MPLVILERNAVAFGPAPQCKYIILLARDRILLGKADFILIGPPFNLNEVAAESTGEGAVS